MVSMVYTMYELKVSIDILTISVGLGIIMIFMLGIMLLYRQLKCDSICQKSKTVRYLPMANLVLLVAILLVIGIDII